MSRPSQGPTPPLVRKGTNPKQPPVNKFAGIAPSSGSKFYNGPTVPMDLAKSKKDLEAKVKRGNEAIKKNASDLKIKYQRSSLPQHGFLNSVIIALSLLSIFSLRFCPPPSLSSTLSDPSKSTLRYNPLAAPLTVPKWEEVICTPTNYYRSTVLEPYILPRLQSRFNALRSHPVIQGGSSYVSPYTTHLTTRVIPRARSLLNRISAGTQTTYNRYGKKRFYIAWRQYDRLANRIRSKIRPSTSQFSDMIAHHRAGLSSLTLPDSLIPLRQAVYAGFRAAQSVGGLVLEHTRFGAEEVSKRTLQGSSVAGRRFGPGLVELLERGLDLAEKRGEWAVGQLQALYNTHLHEHVQPHLSTLDSKLYTPHLKTRLTPLYPLLASFVAAPSYPEIRQGLKDVKQSLGAPAVVSAPVTLKEKVIASAKSVVDAVTPSPAVVAAKTDAEEESELDAYFSAGLTAASVSETKEQKKERVREEKRERKEVRIEVDESLDALAARVKAEGEKQETFVRSKLDKIIDSHTKSTASTILQKRISSIQKDSVRIVKAYKKYLNSLDLNVSEKPIQKALRAKVIEAGDKAVAKIDGLWETFRTDCEEGLLVQGAIDKAEVVIDNAGKRVDAAYTGEHVKLGRKLSWFNGVTTSDWSRLHGITAAAGSWRERYQSLLYNALGSARALQSRAIAEVADVLKPFKTDIIDAERDAILKLGGSPSILPIRVPNIASIRDAADMAIGKSKEQIAQALAQAQSVAGYATPSAPVGIIDNAQASASSIAAQARSVYSSATRSASILAGATPTPESIPEHVSSVAAAASASASSIAVEASKSIASVVGASATPDSVRASAESVLAAASSVYHQATRSASIAIGATPSPETLSESVDSVIAVVSSVGGSVLEVATSTVSSVYAEASSVIIAPVITPAVSILAEFSSTASSLVIEASSAIAPVISDASSIVHDATRSAISAVGATPSPEGVAEHLSSLAAQASSSYSSATRAASKAVGATPTPETLDDHVEALLEGMAGFKESVISVAEAAASSASSLASEGTQAVKVAVGRDEL